MCSFKHIAYLFSLFLALNWVQVRAQYEENFRGPLSLGIAYGSGSQQTFPFNSANYNYEYKSFRILFNYRVLEFANWKLEMTVEPSLYSAQHQLLNENYVQPKHGSNYLELRESLVMEKTITEYALDLGILLRHQTFKNVSLFIQGSVGPMISDHYTERLAKGFAFSDIIALGCSPKVGSLQLSFRTGFRHVSNLNFKSPNSGYNAVMTELAITYNFQKNNDKKPEQASPYILAGYPKK